MARPGYDGVLYAELLEDRGRINLAFSLQLWDSDYRMCFLSSWEGTTAREKLAERGERLRNPGAQSLQEVGQDTLK